MEPGHSRIEISASKLVPVGLRSYLSFDIKVSLKGKRGHLCKKIKFVDPKVAMMTALRFFETLVKCLLNKQNLLVYVPNTAMRIRMTTRKGLVDCTTRFERSGLL